MLEHTATFKFMLNGESVWITIDILELIELINKTKTKARRISISSISLDGLNRSRSTGFSPKRYTHCDCSYPIFVFKIGKESSRNHRFILIDGRHRLYKSIDEGRTYIYAINISFNDLIKCRIRD